MKRLLHRIPGGFKSVLFVFAIGGGLILHFYTQNVIDDLRQESRSFVLFYAKMYARAVETESVEDLNFIFDKIILPTHFPMIYTDANDSPLLWKGIGIDPEDHSDNALFRVKEMVVSLSKEFDPVIVHYQDMVLGKLYYGDSKLISKLRLLPYVESGIVVIFILIGFVGYSNIKKSEQRHIWVGMAKETAHQMGTPISSLMGWLEVIKSDKIITDKSLIEEIEHDVERLEQVAKRFSQIGSKPNIKKQNVTGTVHDTIEYLRRRLPHISRSVVINEHFDQVPPVKVTPELFKWALENIIKNSLDAMDKDNRVVDVFVKHDKTRNTVIIDIRDNGRGMDLRQKRHIFYPGFSTKKRGWGLGLALAKRIIEEYHMGRVYVKETKPGIGTVMRIELNV
ncbi:sensor histidine kinase [candidate division KSB1 bacterium]|nr:MAG: sensor histidine kinase [candidate division KSB1 bacterium]